MLTIWFRRCTVSALFLLSLACAGCLAPTVTTTPLAPGLTMTPVAEQLQSQRPVAVSPDGSLLALVRRGGLFLHPVLEGMEKKLSSELPVALAFNPSGTELAAAFVAADGSRVRRFATSNGEVLAEISFSGRCDALLNREGEWLIFVTTLETFSFGGHLGSRLLRWDGEHAPAESSLNNMTLYHSTLAEKKDLSATLRPQLSPHGDEILFLRLHDPPALAPYLEVVLRHLETGRERLVARLPRLRGAATYLDGGDLVAYGDGINLVEIDDPWSETESQYLTRPGQLLAAPPAGELLWVDDALLRRDGDLLLSVTKQVQPVSFLPGGRLLLRENERLWMISGLPAAPSEPPVPDTEQLRLLRKWRAEGLINAREYAERVKQ